MKTVFIPLLLLAVVVGGCETKSEARAQATANARAAYEAGQADAYRQILQSQGTNIHVLGHVKNPDVPWKDGLTLTQVIWTPNAPIRAIPRDFYHAQRAAVSGGCQCDVGRPGLADGTGGMSWRLIREVIWGKIDGLSGFVESHFGRLRLRSRIILKAPHPGPLLLWGGEGVDFA